MNLKDVRADQERRARIYQTVFDADNGKIVLEDLKSFCGFERPSVDEQHPNELNTFFKEGKRRVFLHILNQLTRKVSNE
jgi:hypothetical protein